MSESVELVIVGGGPAGMSAALVAGRARLRTVVINAEAPRNARSKASHGFVTRDGAHALELLEVAKAQLAPYRSVEYVSGQVTAARALPDGGFSVEIADGRRWQTGRLLLATGQRDDVGRFQMPGLDAVYGASVFPCPFCDGFEHRDERLAVFAGGDAERYASVVRVWSEDIVVFTHGEALTEPAREALLSRGIRAETARVKELVSTDGRLREVVLEDGTRVERDAGFIGLDTASPAHPLLEALDVPRVMNPWGRLTFEADEMGKTKLDGLYVVGDLKRSFGGLVAAAYDGSMCATGIVHDVGHERWEALARP